MFRALSLPCPERLGDSSKVTQLVKHRLGDKGRNVDLTWLLSNCLGDSAQAPSLSEPQFPQLCNMRVRRWGGQGSIRGLQVWAGSCAEEFKEWRGPAPSAAAPGCPFAVPELGGLCWFTAVSPAVYSQLSPDCSCWAEVTGRGWGSQVAANITTLLQGVQVGWGPRACGAHAPCRAFRTELLRRWAVSGWQCSGDAAGY